ncbi:hypothetical protein [Natronobiforma cellulositropha]|uniref:hypothetical protein n=1 Tax=Natronobiforma cellulositropha TaxID=1679076 RepID=UPI0021D5F1A6|nr:hypothetical protein [Natronobiforma cellulositropha]
MDAIITGESKRVGLSVLDNNQVEHLIEMDEFGNIKYHDQDGYADSPNERTDEENEHVNQARRYARYHVYRERGYETLERVDNPDCILAAMIAVGCLSGSAFERHFGDLYDRLREHVSGSRIDLPVDGANPDGIVVYRKDLYLEPDPTAVQKAARTALTTYGAEPGDSIDGETLTAALEKLATDSTLEGALAFEIEATSPCYALYNDGYNNEHVEPVGQPLEREPDARVEPMPISVDSLPAFQEYLLAHLAYQVRDCYVCMGVTPPAGFRDTGYGKYRCSLYQQSTDLYENYYDESESIDSW